MAVKRCPSCQQTLPVACKSCPCGHVFITKKCHIPKQDSEDEKNEHLPMKRLRPERPKREIPDYEYHDVYARASLNGCNTDSQVKIISKRMKLFCENDDDDDDNFSLVSHDSFERSNSIEQGRRPKKKRGRPKGSKNKPKSALLAGITGENGYNDDQESQALRKPGRPKGSKNRVNPDLDGETDLPIKVQGKRIMLRPIPPEKVVMYSLILSDINERLMSQNKIKCLPGF